MSANFLNLTAVKKGDGIKSIEFKFHPILNSNQQNLLKIFRSLDDVTSGWESTELNKTSLNRVPTEPGLYMFGWEAPSIKESPLGIGFNNFVCYVGIAGKKNTRSNLRERFKSYLKYVDAEPIWLYRDAATRDELLYKYLALPSMKYFYIVFEDTSNMEDYERRLIEIFNPPINQNYNNFKASKTKTIKAF